MIVLAGGDIVLPDRILSNASVIIDEGRIAAIDRTRGAPAGAQVVDVANSYLVPGFIDVHVHGVEGHDALDGVGSIAAIAERLPRYGVTAFCPTTVACRPQELAATLEQIAAARATPVRGASRVLAAHLESNFINPEYKGAQPAACLRVPNDHRRDGHYSGRDILDVIESRAADVGIITVAPEIEGVLDLIPRLVRAGHRVSLGHSGADFDQAVAAIDAGARHATHLFNRMTPITHRAPGLAGAVLSHAEVQAELICDGFHVHPAMSRVAIAAKGVDGVMAITDGTGGSGLAPGAIARLGGRSIRVSDQAALLDDGTLAGSTLTMDRAFRNVVTMFGASITDAAIMCSTTPARALGLTRFGVLAEGNVADLVVLDRGFGVSRTFIDGEEVYRSSADPLRPRGR
ncbi:MAG TPA: N-acetylglucosamine-6-phosphate deacetylase [Vicinamibacterales bacterium]|jgi:N-acetylglucosamine-6-phosphate deacetylase|nr:N-acetylglucosamine-6-phosphate deacetylase [Vicinamibacterales bacterium]